RLAMNARLVPELDVANLTTSLAFYVDVIGCIVLYTRTEENFVFLDLEGAHLMLQQASGPGRRFRTAPLEYPYGRGVNFQIRVANVDQLYERVRPGNAKIIIPIESKWYRRDDAELGNRQFVVADPDGY